MWIIVLFIFFLLFTIFLSVHFNNNSNICYVLLVIRVLMLFAAVFFFFSLKFHIGAIENVLPSSEIVAPSQIRILVITLFRTSIHKLRAYEYKIEREEQKKK